MVKKTGGKKNQESVQVCVRLRPLNSKEKSKKCKQVLFVNSDRGEVAVKHSQDSEDYDEMKRYTYDFAFPPTVTQEEVFDLTARPIVESVMEGYNGTIFAYGQTGTGKTWTMEGDRSSSENKGIIPRSFEQIFSIIETEGEDKKFLVRGSFLEIYNNCIFDLQKDHGPDDHGLKLKEVRDRDNTSVHAVGLTQKVCKSPDDLFKILKEGSHRRQVASTQMNRASSRSHCIFTCIVEQCPKDDPSGQGGGIKVGKLNMVDLAGSERAKKTGAEGDTLNEAKAINMSLSALGNVISALTVKRIKHVPYRNSKLTRLLQDSLGGNTKTTMLAALGPADYNMEESISTLRFAKRAKSIKNKPTVNMNPKDALLMDMQKEIEVLRKQLMEINSVQSPTQGMPARGGLRLNPMKPRKKVVKKVVEKVIHKGVTKEEIERARKEAEDRVKIEEEKRKKLIRDLKVNVTTAKERAEELRKTVETKEKILSNKQQIRQTVMTKLKAIQNQLVVGEKLKEQVQRDRLVFKKQQVLLKQQKLEEAKLKVKLQQRKQQNLALEEKFSTKDQEVASKTKKLERLRSMYKQILLDIEDVQAENQHEREEMLQEIRDMSRMLKLKDIILDNFVPREQLQSFSQRCYLDDDTDEWKLGKVDVKEESMTARPKSAKSGYTQPTSEFERLSSYMSDGNARFKMFNIMTVELIRPKRTTRDYVIEGEEEEYEEHEYQEEYQNDAGGGALGEGHEPIDGGYADGDDMANYDERYRFMH